MTNEQYLLTLLAEECAEVSQRATKAIRFGLEDPKGTQEGFSTNKQRLLWEINDLIAVIELLFGNDYVDESLKRIKKEKIEKYTQLSKEIGQL